MKTTRLVIIAGLCLFMLNTIKAQVKIGDNPLDISDNRLLEIESAGEFFLVKDTTGITIGRADNLNDPLMLKLYGYGLGSFTPAITGTSQAYFLGTNPAGEMLEFPLILDLNNTTSPGELSFDNGDVLFGSVQLDSVFSTDLQLRDSINVLRTLVAASESADGDTITGNEWISSIQMLGANSTELTITENTTGIGPTNTRSLDLDDYLATDIQLEDTAAVLRRFNFYLSDNTFDDALRRASGAGITNLTFDSLSQFNISNTPIINLNSTTGNVNITSDDSDVDINAASGSVLVDAADATVTTTGATEITASDIDLNASTSITADAANATVTTTGITTITASDIDLNTSSEVTVDAGSNIDLTAVDTINITGGDNIKVDGNVQLADHGAGKTGTEAYLLGVDAAGNVLDVDITSIGGDAALEGPVDLDEDGTEENTVQEAIDALEAEIDSTIYNYDGTLTGNRVLTGNTNSLTFDDLSTVAITNTATLDVDATTVDLDGTTYTADYTTSTSTTTGTNTVQSSGADVVIDASTTLDMNATTVDVDATDVTIDATNNTLVTTTGFGVTASAAVVIDGDNSLLRTVNTNTITSTTGDVEITSVIGNVEINATDTVNITAGDNVKVDGNVQLTDHGAGKTGTEAYLLGVDAAGNVLDVDITSIGGDAALEGPVDLDEDGTEENTVQEAIDALEAEIDSTIYNYDGTLTGARVMTMDGNDLTFAGATTATSALISSDGKMVLGGTSFTANSATSDVRLEVVGDIFARRVHSSSDRRFKKNILPIDSALEKVKKINGVTYDFRVDEFKSRNFSTEKQVGFIAQNIESVLPEVVMTDGEGFKAVDYAKITALLTEAIKDQQKIIENQQQVIASQGNQLSTQDDTLSQMVDVTDDLKSEISELKAMIQTVFSTHNMSDDE